MSAEVQHLLDRLADDLGRSVVINDPAVVMLYSSRHFGDEDPVRVEAMLNRVAGSAAIAHVLAQDVARWTRPGRIRPSPRSACGPGCACRCAGAATSSACSW